MTNPSELTEAIERYRERRAKIMTPFPVPADAHFIADAFTDPAEITPERLEALGFVASNGRLVYYQDAARIYAAPSCGDFWFSYCTRESQANEQYKPQPQFMCDVAYLIYRLGRTKETR